MRIGFFGTPGIAACALEGLCKAHSISFLVTTIDKPSGRNLIMNCCPAKSEAIKEGIPILQPQSLRDPAAIKEIISIPTDVYVVVAYGKIIPREIFDHPKFGTLNLHPSLLPKYRGAAPVQWALINGDEETGITIQRINEELDAGDIIIQEKFPLSIETNAADIFAKINLMSAALLDRAITLVSSPDYKPIVQNNNEATYCGKITADLARINWSNSALSIHNLVRAFNPKPVAISTFRGSFIKIHRTMPIHKNAAGLAQGEIGKIGKKRLVIGTADGLLEILEIQPSGKKVMDALSFINGSRLLSGELFE
jgi:methionyl-tRNA formyltransferase